jgi:alpha-glucoside transport system substrate-binding protein
VTLVGGEFVAAFNDRPEVQAFQAYLSSPEWANEKAKATTALGQTGWISANSGLDTANLTSPIDISSVEILQDPERVARFDGSDLMPGEVGSGTFWTAMTNWITGASSADVLTQVESTWPQQ